MGEEKKKITPRDLALPILLAAVLITLIAYSLVNDGSGGGEDPVIRKEKHFFGYFNTAVDLYDYSGLSDGEFKELCALAAEELDFYHRLFDIYNTYDKITNLKTLNDHAGEGALEISEELFDFLDYSKRMYTLTSGEVNIAMGAVLSIWHGYRELGEKAPDIKELEAAAHHTDINDLILDREKMTAELKDPLMSLDVGAIAKGYSAERIAEMLSEHNYSSVVLDLGGNIRAIGEKVGGGGWRTGVRDPDPDQDGYIYEFELSDGSAVTSGNYERYYIADGKKYHHIIDKDTLMPSEYFASVTVITPDSALADALSTALFNMSYEEGLALVNALDNVKVIWLTVDGKLEISK